VSSNKKVVPPDKMEWLIGYGFFSSMHSKVSQQKHTIVLKDESKTYHNFRR